MASISTDKQGFRRILFINQDGKRKQIRLGKCKMEQARVAKSHIEELVACKMMSCAPRTTTAEWVAMLPDSLRSKLERAGLVAVREHVESPTLADWVEKYIKMRTDVKPNTALKYCHTQKKLMAFFDKSRRIDDFTVGDAEAFRIFLKKDQSEATTRRLCGVAKQFFAAAVKRHIIRDNPFTGVVCANIANPSRKYFVSREEARAVLEACPNAEWRLIFALCRFGGLRCPSELLTLEWSHINWEKMRFLVHSSKTEHHANHGIRVVPIFPELYPHLRKCFELAEPGAEYVITRYRETNINLRTQLNRIIKRAGLKPWPKLFQNLRSTRETELTQQFPLHVACEWIGNSDLVAAQHYLQVTDDHYSQALQKAAQNPAQHSEERCRIGQYRGDLFTGQSTPRDKQTNRNSTTYDDLREALIAYFRRTPSTEEDGGVEKTGLLGIEPRTF